MNAPPSDTEGARLRLQQALKRAPLFADLDPATMAAVERELTQVLLPGGACLFRQGDPSNALYIVASGCLGVFRSAGDNQEPGLMAEIPPGDIVGEMSLLSHRPRARTVAALRDSEVWRLSQDDFELLATRHPEALPALVRKVAERTVDALPRPRRQPRTFAILPAGPDVPAARFAVSLAGALGRLGDFVQMLGPELLDRDPEWFTRCETDASYVIYRAEATLTPWTELCLRQADCLVVVRRADDDLPTRLPFELESAQTAGVFRRRRELVLLHDGRDPKPGSTAPLLAGGVYGQHHHIRLDLHSDIDRLARLLTAHAVGVVMAGGGARGFAHIGVVKALRASGVPIDLVGGSSMGSIIAAGVAARWTDEELAERFRRSFVVSNPLSDYTLPLVSFFSGRKVNALLKLAFGEMDIEDLALPFFCMTSNLTTATADTHMRGKLWRWLRATVSIPGVLAPFNENGQVHVDGGIMDNFPVRSMRKLEARHHHRHRHRHGRRPGRRRRRGRALVGVGVLQPHPVAAQGDTADSLDRAHPAALGAGLERGALPGRPRPRRPADPAADEQLRSARLDELRCRGRDRLSGGDGSARQGQIPAARRAHLRQLTTEMAELSSGSAGRWSPCR